jgi:ribonucleoside-diphosphate reductase alpha chain
MELSENARKVLEKRYLKDGETPEGMFRRVAHAIASVDERPAEAERSFYEVMDSLEFLPNSPTLMNAGRELGQLAACFVLPVGDSIPEIFEAIKQTALIHKSGGGTGFSFSRLRPKNDLVKTTSGVSSGPVSFMGVFNAATEAIKQGGTRRGANMGMLRVDHPDIVEFIKAKEDPTALTNFNLSIGITDDFMTAVGSGSRYGLVNPHTWAVVGDLDANEVWSLIVDHAWESGEPGVVFIDRMNQFNPTPSIGSYEATNPCGEQPLLPYESCNLGSINLGKMVFGRKIDWCRLEEVVKIAVRFLDNVIDVNKYPLPEIEEVTKGNRKIGLGVMGFADMLIQLGVKYDSEQALQLAGEVMQSVRHWALEESARLGVVRGLYPNCSTLPGRRNATVTTIAPTGTLSIIAGCSSGIEPIFAASFTKNVMDDAQLGEKNTSEFLRTAHDVSPEYHVRMQDAFQMYTDNAVSKTVNLPHDATREDVKRVFDLAYALDCKGVTVYRDGSRDNQVLRTEPLRGRVSVALSEPVRHRPSVLPGRTFKQQTGCGSIYITINSDELGPCELFATIGKAGGCADSQSQAIGRMVSMAWRYGISAKETLKQLSDISCHSHCGMGERRVKSCADAVSKAIRQYLEEKGEAEELPEPKVLVNGACKECGGKIEHEGGCVVCRSCGFSECG